MYLHFLSLKTKGKWEYVAGILPCFCTRRRAQGIIRASPNKPMESLKTKIFLIRLKKGEPAAYQKLYDTYVDKIYRFIFFKVSSREDAEDLTSEVFLKVYQYITDQKNVIQHLNALLYQIARHRVIDYYRRREGHPAVSLDDVSPSELSVRIAPSHDGVAQGELYSYLQKLKDEYREVVILRYLEGYSTREAAKILGKKSGAVRVLLHRAMKNLTEIANFGSSTEEVLVGRSDPNMK